MVSRSTLYQRDVRRTLLRIVEHQLLCGDCLEVLPTLPAASARLIIADSPYFNVLPETWDRQWADAEAYLSWSLLWIEQAMRLLAPGGLCCIFGQVGKREHVFLHLMSEACKRFAFHDLIIWDRVVGYNDRRDSFTPAYEQMLILRQEGAAPYFDKDAVREPYDADTIERYMKDNRYTDLIKRRKHLEKGKYATNIWRIPSLKGKSIEKVGFPSQKPLVLIERIVSSCSQMGDLVIDPFSGSGTTLVACNKLRRHGLGVEISPEYVELAKTRLALNSFGILARDAA